MVREFRDKKIHNLNEAHKILHLNEIIENPFKGNLLFFKVSELEVAGGINLDRLIFENRQIIVKQLAYLKYKKPSLIHAQNVLKKSQEIYRNF